MEQLDIFVTQPRVYYSDPTPKTIKFTVPYQPSSETSKAGAEHAKPNAATQCHTIMVYLTLEGKKGATACELRRATGIAQASTMSARLNSLMKAGKIRDSGERRKSRANVDNIVWCIA